jgi:hypothetical protein
MKNACRILGLVALVLMGCGGNSGPHVTKFGGAPPPGRIVYSDPSISPGQSGAVGEVVYLSGGTASWVKSTTSNTGWSTFPSAGGGGGFGSDVLVPLPNSSAVNVTALELVASLTTDTPGAETGAWAHKLISGGAQTTSQDERPAQTLFPQGGSAATPPMSFQDYPHSGLYATNGSGSGATIVSVNSYPMLLCDYAHGVVSGGSPGNPFLVGTDYLRGMGQLGSNVELFSNADVQVGADGALATNATLGFLDVPSMAGTPSGTPGQVRGGKAPILVDSSGHHLWFNDGSWRNENSSQNFAGAQTATTPAGVTPSIALTSRSDILYIVVDHDINTLTVSGLDSDVDAGYDIEGSIVVSTAEIDISLNASNSGATLKGFYISAGTLTAFNPTVIIFCDQSTLSHTCVTSAKLRSVASGVAKTYDVTMYAGNGDSFETYHGNSSLTADVTSIQFGAMKNGSKMTLRRVRPTVN